MASMNNFSNDIINNILLNLPEKSLLRFKLVCKSWDSLIIDPQFVKQHYYLNQIFKALKKEGDCSINNSMIGPPSVISHQLSLKFVNSRMNDFFLLAVELRDRIVFWNPEDLSELETFRRPIDKSTLFKVGECDFLARSVRIRFTTRSDLEVRSKRRKGPSSCMWRTMLKIEEEGPLFLKKGSRDFLFIRKDKNESIIYDSKTQKFNEVADGIIGTKQKLKQFKIAGPQVSLFIDPTYVETLFSPNST